MDVAVFHKVCFQKQSMHPIWSMDHHCIQDYRNLFKYTHTHTHTHTQYALFWNDFSLTLVFRDYFHLSLCLKNFPYPESIDSAKLSQVNVEPIDILPQIFSYLDETDKCRILESHALYLRTGRQRPLYNLLMAEITPANPGGRSDHSGMSFKSLWGRKNMHVKVMRVSTRHRVSQKEINQ